MAAPFVLTADQLSKIQDLSSRLSRDPAFLSAVGTAYKSVAPKIGPDDPGSKTASEKLASHLSHDPAFLALVEQAFKGVLPRIGTGDPGKTTSEQLASFGWSIPVADDDGHASAAVMAAIAVAAAGALAEK
jgi:BioD-like phosphotransacetylase family protein